MKPSFTPYRAVKASWCSARRALTRDMSISLKVVSRAAVCCDATSRSAIRRRMGLILWRRTFRSPVIAGAAGTGRGAVAGAAEAEKAAGARHRNIFFQHPAAGARTLDLVGPEPPFGHGPLGRRHDMGLGRREGASFSPGGVAAATAASVSIRASTSPVFRTAPSSTRISTRTPAAGAGTSTVALSDSSSITGSSRATESPCCFRKARDLDFIDGLAQVGHCHVDPHWSILSGFWFQGWPGRGQLVQRPEHLVQ